MVQKISFFCDVCGIEFPPKEYSFLNGQIIKMNAEYKPEPFAFAGHYCGDCTQTILEKISELKNGHSKKKK